MEHVAIKIYPGKTEFQKKQLSEEITKNICDILNATPDSVSVTIEEVDKKDWLKKVYEPDIRQKEKHLYKKPGYSATKEFSP